MLKFIKHHMETIDGISIYPIISFLIFFIFFLLMLIYVIRADKNRMKEIANIPLDDEPINPIDHEK
ncbi:CcoQ/FixQ family Cbb3-type cytochrome c oxidase assembly chaperone [Owenweeksia hongkongensis]|uniref:Cbb3-type cytochrome oxidase component FixQ n=1 Tax=Owenweeksia hongkongensis (strain DSM 17368 / CIP 108786 / JCM 12287 / NRRL B-23963 / UST20020801) TaxID=926562 RepID=G8R3K5_OWEHD|nr:CcoQ/FixQ family Cbb3-type cytochrome c oxidase assembly chaperone [Owenweeksia hongkongensis]AEV33061.1 Cbb3-type cytochrome oxidase component FixQ [Owenweeksia hongkongensis DSM 17368]